MEESLQARVSFELIHSIPELKVQAPHPSPTLARLDSLILPATQVEIMGSLVCILVFFSA